MAYTMLMISDVNKKAIILMAVILAHLLALYWATRQMVLPVFPPKERAIQAVVIMPVALPLKVEPPPKVEPIKPKPIVQPKIQPVVQKQAVLPPSEKAITIEKPVIQEVVKEVSEPTPPVNEPPPPVVAKAEPPPEPEVIPPRSDASSLNNPKPAYPAMSRRLAEQGKVLLEVFILANGKVGEIKIKQSSGFKRLDDAAMQAVRQWQYQPAKRGNQPIDFWYVQPIAFSLDT